MAKMDWRRPKVWEAVRVDRTETAYGLAAKGQRAARAASPWDPDAQTKGRGGPVRRLGAEEIAALNLEQPHWDPGKAVLLGRDGKPLPPGAPLPTVRVPSQREALAREVGRTGTPSKPPVRFGPRR